MKSISGLGLGLSLVFGCLLLALIAELYYLLWWKKRIITKIDENGSQTTPKTSHFFHIFCCWKRPAFSSSSSAQELCSSVVEPQSSSNSNKDSCKEENMSNFSRFLFTITEETREDLESDDGIAKNRKQSTSRSNLSDLLQVLETPFLTPLASPPYFTPPLTPSFADHHQESFSRFFESGQDAEFNRLRSSPPPKLKFLRDAEEKLIRRQKIVEESENGENKDEENGQFVTLIVAKNEEAEICKNDDCNNLEKECFSSSSPLQVLQQIHNTHVKLNVC